VTDLENFFKDDIVGRGWTRARLALELGVNSSTLKKWFKAAGLPAGKRGRPRKSGALGADLPDQDSIALVRGSQASNRNPGDGFNERLFCGTARW